MASKITQVTTHIITGFLGTGKTSTIQHLLKYKPERERWAVLVNEFGTVGIDGTLYQNTNTKEGGVFVREVPGGCMCCVSGLPMQIALNVLLKVSNPHRLLIEPSGLGHPVEVVSLLKSKYYKDVLDIQKIITLIDPQQFIQAKYFEHPTYQQQLEIADTCIVNKIDMCADSDLDKFKHQCIQSGMQSDQLIYATHGQIEPVILNGVTGFLSGQKLAFREPPNDSTDEMPDLTAIPPHIGYLVSKRFDEGYHAISWRYLKSIVFNKNKLLAWLKTLKAERIKGVLLTDSGFIGVNCLQGQMKIDAFNDCKESRLEIISSEVDPTWEVALKECITDKKRLRHINQLIAG